MTVGDGASRVPVQFGGKGVATMEVGFLGTGRMGKAMAANLLKAGHHVRAWDKAT